MLALADKYRPQIAKSLGYDIVEFRKGMIQDLKLNAGLYEAWLKLNPATDLESMAAAEAEAQRLRREEPLVEDNSVDVVVSNCVLNLVRDGQKKQLFEEIFRVLKRGGRAVISDIVSDEVVPAHQRQDAELWSGCISGAFQEAAFLRAFENAGFYGLRVLKRDEKPWKVVEGIEFRSVTVEAFKGKEGPCLDRGQAVIYGGPWKEVKDDDGHTLRRGELMAVCDKTYKIYTSAQGPYARHLLGIEPENIVPLDAAPKFDCRVDANRDPKELKGASAKAAGFDPDSEFDGPACGPGCC
jgi:SAM-dependent methyltransferase